MTYKPKIIGDQSKPPRLIYDPTLPDKLNREAKENPRVEPSPKPTTPTLESPRTNTPSYIYVPKLDLEFRDQKILTNLDWNQTQEELKSRGEHMPTPYQMREFLKHLRDSKDPRYQTIFKEILEVRDPWRACWLNAMFEKRKKGMYLLSTNPLNQPTETKLEDYLTENKTPVISLDSYLSSTTSHGLPSSNTPDGKFYYWRPTNGNVAVLGADSYGAALNCNWGPSDHDGSLRVFALRSSARSASKKSGGSL